MKASKETERHQNELYKRNIYIDIYIQSINLFHEEVNVLCICKKLKSILLINKYIKNYNPKQVLSKQLKRIVIKYLETKNKS